MVTRDELLSQLREQGIEDYLTVKLAQLEEDGHLSVITKKGTPRAGPGAKKGPH